MSVRPFVYNGYCIINHCSSSRIFMIYKTLDSGSLITFLIGDPSLLSNTNKHTLIQNKSNEALNSIDSISFNLIKVGGMMVGLMLVKTSKQRFKLDR